MYQHGGDVYRNSVNLDFSVNINPLGMPKQAERALHDAVAQSVCYPDAQSEQLRADLALFWKIPKQCLLLGNGASELFFAVVHGLQPKKTVIPVPSFYGYEHAAAAGLGECIFYEMKKEAGFAPDEGLFSVLTEDVELLFLANPNNPTGVQVEREYLQKLLLHCKERGIYVVLDECFLAFCENGQSAVSLLFGDMQELYSHVLLVRAFTKLFAVPGIRLGYLIGSDTELLKRLQRQLPEWNLSCFAQAGGCACLKQQEYLEQTKDVLSQERKFLKKGFWDLGFSEIFGEANFLFFYSPYPLYEALLARGILIRDCANFRGLKKGYYRAAVKSREENVMLLQEIEKIKKEGRHAHAESEYTD